MSTLINIRTFKANVDLKEAEVVALNDDQLYGINGGVIAVAVAPVVPITAAAPTLPSVLSHQPGPSCPGYR
jgi:hypothetical protein